MIKIKTKVIKEDKNNSYVGVSYKTKDSNSFEHLVVVNHLIQEIKKTNEYSSKELLDIIKVYVGKEEI